jgi:hypothetical protein
MELVGLLLDRSAQTASISRIDIANTLSSLKIVVTKI